MCSWGWHVHPMKECWPPGPWYHRPLPMLSAGGLLLSPALGGPGCTQLASATLSPGHWTGSHQGGHIWLCPVAAWPRRRAALGTSGMTEAKGGQLVTSWPPTVATLLTLCIEWPEGQSGPLLGAWGWGQRRQGVGVSLFSPPHPARPLPRTNSSHPMQPSQGSALLHPSAWTLWEPWEPCPQPSWSVSPAGEPQPPQSRWGCAGGHHSSGLRPAGPEAPGPREVTDGAERGDPCGGRSGGSGLMVTLRGIVHCSEPGPCPTPPSAEGIARHPQTQALQRGACPRALAIYKRARPTGLGQGCRPTDHQLLSSGAWDVGSRPHCSMWWGSRPLGPSPGRPPSPQASAWGGGLQPKPAKAEPDSSSREPGRPQRTRSR